MKRIRQKKTAKPRKLIVVILLAIAIFIGRLLGWLLTALYENSKSNPLGAVGVFIFIVTFGFVSFNALFSQNSYHQAPLFETRALPRKQPLITVVDTIKSSNIKDQFSSRSAQLELSNAPQFALPTGNNTPVPVQISSGGATTVPSSQKNISASSQNLLQLQKKMSSAGFYSGPLDGLDGPKTRAALSEWENDKATNKGSFYDITQNKSIDLSTQSIDQITTNAVISNAIQSEQQGAAINFAPSQDESFTTLQADVFRVQAGLRLFGYNSVAISGVEDGETAQALRAFQKMFSLQVTGRVTPEVIKKMREIGIFG